MEQPPSLPYKIADLVIENGLADATTPPNWEMVTEQLNVHFPDWIPHLSLSTMTIAFDIVEHTFNQRKLGLYGADII